MSSPKRLRIHRTRVVAAASLSPAERADLARRLFAIFCQTFNGAELQLFAERTLFRSPDARIALFYGRSGELAGFASASVTRLESGGATHAIFNAGVYFDLRYNGGDAAARFGLLEALRLRVSSPGVRLWYVAETTSPAPYCLYGRTLNALYPHPERETPAEVTAIVRAFAEQRGMRQVGEDPHVARYDHGSVINDSGRVQQAASLRDDPFSAFFLRRNPSFAEGNRLLVAIPLDWKNVLFGLLCPLRALLRRLASPSSIGAALCANEMHTARALPMHNAQCTSVEARGAAELA
jgi:hypothetical protein